MTRAKEPMYVVRVCMYVSYDICFNRVCMCASYDMCLYDLLTRAEEPM